MQRSQKCKKNRQYAKNANYAKNAKIAKIAKNGMKSIKAKNEKFQRMQNF